MELVKQKMKHARQQRELLQGGSRSNAGQTYVSLPHRRTGTPEKSFKTIWIPGVAATWLATVFAAWFAGSRVTPFDASPEVPVNTGTTQTSEVAGLQTRIATSGELENYLDDLNKRMQALGYSIASVESGLIRVLVLAESQSGSTGERPSAVVRPRSPVAISKPVREQPATNLASPPVLAVEEPLPDQRQAVSAVADAPWVINLASLPSKADADRYSAGARSKGVQVEQHPATIRGKKYWRVQAGGFVTSADAMFQADIIKEKLGLKDVWITKR